MALIWSEHGIVDRQEKLIRQGGTDFCSTTLFLGCPSQKPRRPLPSCKTFVQYCIDEAMLDPHQIPLFRVKQAYRLNGHEAQSLLNELSPENVFPYEIWQKAYASCWKYPAAEASRLYEVENPPFPETHQQPVKHCPTDVYAEWMMKFFFEMAQRISAVELEKGFDYIIESTYDDKLAVSETDREFLFRHLVMADKNIANVTRIKGVKDIDLRLSAPDMILKIFPDTIAVDTIAAIHHWSVVRNYSLAREVKGISQKLVDFVTKAAARGTPTAGISIPQPQVQPTAPPSTGSRKDIERIEATRQVCEDLLKELLQERQVFENDKNTWKPNLLYSNGKTLNKTFLSAAEKRLDRKPHGAAAKEVWKKVPAKIKHNGRMPEQ